MISKLFPTNADVQRWTAWAAGIGCEVSDTGGWFVVNCPTGQAEDEFLDGVVGNWSPKMAWGQYSIAYHEILKFACCRDAR